MTRKCRGKISMCTPWRRVGEWRYSPTHS